MRENKHAYLPTVRNKSDIVSYLNIKYKERLKQWFNASSTGNLEELKKIFAYNDINVNARDKDGNTALILSASQGSLGCVKYLLRQGADLTWKGESGKNASTLAEENNKTDVLQYLKQRNYQLESWFDAAKQGDITSLQERFEEGDINVNARDKSGYTALLWSAQGPTKQQSNSIRSTTSNIDSTEGGYYQCVKYLVEQGANIHARDDRYNSTPLLKSAGRRQHAILKYLLDMGANLTDQDNDGYTAFLLSAYSGLLKSLKYLLNKFSDHVNIENSNRYGATALLLSAENGREAFVQYLLKKNADIHATNKAGHTALRLSVNNGYIKMCEASSVQILRRKVTEPIIPT